MTAGNVKKVWLLARRGSLEATMSYYLVERIKAQPRRWARIGAPRYVALTLAAVLKNIPPWTPPRRR
jgi:hypothetical protein